MFRKRPYLLPFLMVMIAIMAIITSVGAIWVQNVGLLPGTAIVLPADAPAIDRFMAASMKSVYGNRVQLAATTTANVGIQAAFNSLPVYTDTVRFGGGDISLWGGIYTFASPVYIDLLNNGPIIHGVGRGTLIHVPNGTSAFIVGSASNFSYGTVFKDFKFNGNGTGKGISVPNGDTILFEGIVGDGIDTLVSAMGDAGEVHMLVFKNVTAFNIANAGIDLAGSINFLDNVYLESTTLQGATLVWVRSTASKTSIRDSMMEIGGIGIQADSGGNELNIDNVLFNSTFNTYALGLGFSNSTVENSTFNANGALSISIPASAQNITLDNNNWTGSTTQSVSIEGYGNSGFHARNNSFAGIPGVIQDADVESLVKTLGISLKDADIIYPFSNLDGVDSRVWDVSKIENLYLFATPTWGTVASTGWGKLTLDGTSQYGKYPNTGVSNIFSMSGNKTLVFGIMPTDPSTTSHSDIVASYYVADGAADTWAIAQGLVSGHEYTLEARGNSATTGQLTLNSSWSAGEPMVLAFTSDSNGVIKGYSNGKYIGTFTIDPFSSTPRILYLGARSSLGVGDFLHGSYSFFGSWDTILPNEEINRLSNKVLNLMGATTETSGSGVILNGQTSVAFTYSLGMTPNINSFALKPTNLSTTDPGELYPDRVTSVGFFANSRTDPGATNLSVSWSYSNK